MRILKISLLFLLTAFIFVSCGSSEQTAKDDQRKLSGYNSYAYLPNKDTIMSRQYDNEMIQSTIISTVNANMQDEGYTLNKMNPDVLVYIHPMFDEKVEVNANPVYTNFSYYRPDFYIGPYYKDYMYDNYFTIQRVDGPRISQVPYKEKTIVIDFIDRRSNEILWRGTTDESITDRRMQRSIRQYVDDIFKKFP